MSTPSTHISRCRGTIGLRMFRGKVVTDLGRFAIEAGGVRDVPFKPSNVFLSLSCWYTGGGRSLQSMGRGQAREEEG